MLLIGKVHQGWWDLNCTINGILSGLVSVCSGCNVVDVWVGLFLGSTGSAVYYSFTIILEKMRIDDPLGASALHFGSGAWGFLVAAFFANPALGVSPDQAGVFFGGFSTLIYHLMFLLLTVAWTGGTCGLMFYILKVTGRLRVDAETEIQGMDEHHHGGTAYHTEVAHGIELPTIESQVETLRQRTSGMW